MRQRYTTGYVAERPPLRKKIPREGRKQSADAFASIVQVRRIAFLRLHGMLSVNGPVEENIPDEEIM